MNKKLVVTVLGTIIGVLSTVYFYAENQKLLADNARLEKHRRLDEHQIYILNNVVARLHLEVYDKPIEWQDFEYTSTHWEQKEWAASSKRINSVCR